MTSRALLRNIYGWQKAIKMKEMAENSRISNDCRFPYMLDFILKPGGKLEYQDNASQSKFKGISTPAENRVGNSSVSKGFDQLERASATHAPVNFARVSENDVIVYKQLSSLYILVSS